MNNDVIEFLRESNNIENVWDDDSMAQAVKAWEFIVQQKELTIDNILEMHNILMLNQKISEEDKGFFRKRPVWIGGHEAKPYWALTVLMENWLKQANNSNKEEDIKKDHIHYEAIHPFIDGNGRTGRIFLNFQRNKVGLPILIIKNDEKDKYYEWFNKRK